jgi:hypothetical protein
MTHPTRAEIGLVRLGDSDFVPANPEDDVRGKDVYDGESHPEERRAKILVRSLSVLNEWLERNEGHTDEVRVRRIRSWREEALEQLRLLLSPEDP